MTWYHISTNSNLPRCLTPRCPKNKDKDMPKIVEWISISKKTAR